MIVLHFDKCGGTLIVKDLENAETFAAVLSKWVDINGTELPYEQEVSPS